MDRHPVPGGQKTTRLKRGLIIKKTYIVLALTGFLFIGFHWWFWRPNPLDDFYGDAKVLIIGHRGASAHAPENTLAAFEKAFEMGADAVELDVRLSRDRVVVVLHDRTVGRTTDGEGAVRNYTFEQLKELDAGSWFDRKFTGESVPGLTEVVNALSGQTLFFIDIKGRIPFLYGLEREIAGIINDYDLHERVIVSSFNPFSLLRIRFTDRTIPIGLTYRESPLRWLIELFFIPLLRPEALLPHYELVDHDYVNRMQNRGFRINVYTVNEIEDMRRMVELGVDGIITGFPDMLFKLMKNMDYR